MTSGARAPVKKRPRKPTVQSPARRVSSGDEDPRQGYSVGNAEPDFKEHGRRQVRRQTPKWSSTNCRFSVEQWQ